MKKQKIFFWIQLVVNLAIFAVILGSSFSFAALPSDFDLNKPIPNSEPVTLLELRNIIINIGDFFVIIAPILLVIALVWAAITYMRAGGSPEVTKKATERIKYAVIGGFVIFGIGVIINTIAAIVSRSFFCQLSVLGVCIY